ncbi:MAG: threonine synthase, partial [Clostridia bacterium]|nr:threonine synthase [Clostridia bacterium]
MNYYSTRDSERKIAKTSAEVIKQGIADDGGLFLPEAIPEISLDFIKEIGTLPYSERAAKILSLYLTDYTYDELLDCAKKAYDENFGDFAAPVSSFIGDDLRVLELWHGPTCAFKDMALQIMPRLLSLALKKTGEKRCAYILVATSGDTGKAVLEGYKDVDSTKIMVFYPEDGVSDMQKMQMATQEGSNVRVTAIKGNFDDAQTGVKKIFADAQAKAKLDKKGSFLSSANSINWGRLAPQIVYYISAYADLVAEGDITLGEKVDITVPTGNFGNIFAAYLAKKMGLPVNRFICASNSNNILTDFLRTGTYDRNRKFYTTMSPSMDILISSNLERLLYFIAG